MNNQSVRTTIQVFVIAVVVLMTTRSEVQAHRLEADYRILLDGSIQIESWFDLGNESARGAVVEIFDAQGNRVADGRTDEQGVFMFKPTAISSFRVKIRAGAGHQTELAITDNVIRRHWLGRVLHCLTPGAPALLPAGLLAISSREEPAKPESGTVARFGFSKANLLLGVGLLLGIAAGSIGWRKLRPNRLETMRR